MLRASPDAVRRLAIRKQRLDGRRRASTADALLETVQALRCLQLDPTAVVARSHLLVLYSRHGAFDPELVDRLAFRDRALFEYWAHEASLVLSEDLPIHRDEMRSWPRGGAAWPRKLATWYDAESDFRAHILERLAAEGALRGRDIDDRSTAEWEVTRWNKGPNVGRLLEIMWVRGDVGVARREGATRVWDLMERCLPPDVVPDEQLSPLEVTRRAAVLAIGALGAARPAHVRAHFTRNRYPELERALEELATEGVLEGLAVDGLGDDWWVRADDVEALEASRPVGERTTLLSPFDNLLCDRARTEALFGFSHRLETYTPAAKRRWGYYVMPVLDGDRLVARCDLAIDRKAKRLVVHAVHAEEGLRAGVRLPRAIRRELERLAEWRGAPDVEVRAAPDAWRAALARD